MFPDGSDIVAISPVPPSPATPQMVCEVMFQTGMIVLVPGPRQDIVDRVWQAVEAINPLIELEVQAPSPPYRVSAISVAPTGILMIGEERSLLDYGHQPDWAMGIPNSSGLN